MNDDLKAIQNLVQTYFDGLYDADADKLGTIFHPTSALAAATDGKLTVVPRDAWLEGVRKRTPGKKAGLVRDDHILAIDMLGPTTALVKVKCQLPPRYFTDLLSLLKIDGRWMVAQKVYHETR